MGRRPFITLNDVSLRLHDRVLFSHTSWEIEQDQQWAVIGPNGSGKSTLMRALCGRVPVVKGRIIYHFAADNPKPHDLVGYVSFDAQRSIVGWQDPFHQARWNSERSEDGLSVSEYLSRDRAFRVNPFQVIDDLPAPAEFAARRDEVVALLGIESLIAKQAIQLSNGERRKVTIARVLLKDPRLLILDNPFTGLDQASRDRLKEIIAQLTQDQMRVMVVETDRDEIPPGITHVLEVADCRVAAQGQLTAIPRPGDPAPALNTAEMEPATDERPDAPILIRMEDVHVSLGGVPVLRGISWTVRRREHWALLGPNGAGKSTLLSLILGDNPQAYANEITLFGRRRGSGESIWEIKRRIGWVAPELHLYYPFDATAFDVVCSGLFDSVGLYHRCSEQQLQEARAWMEHLSIADRADAPFRHMSEGERALVLVARALVKQPELLVLDEPCQGLDARNRDRVLEAVNSVGGHVEHSMIYVTHTADELPGSITHVLSLDDGRVVDSRETGGAARRRRAGE